MVVMILIGLLSISAIDTVTLLDRSSRRQAMHTSAMELAQGRMEELQSTNYNPPLAPFTALITTQTANVILALGKAGTNILMGGLMTTVIAPVTRGHLVTVKVATTNATPPLQVQLQTLINEKSGNQP